MKKLESLSKKELIALVTKIRPKADAYDRVCEEMGIKKNLLSLLKNHKNKRLIDYMQEALKKGKIEFVRDGWKDIDSSKDPAIKDNCEWIDIKIYSTEGDCYTIHFYFTENSTLLEQIQIFFEKKVVAFDDMKRLASMSTIQAIEKEELALEIREKKKTQVKSNDVKPNEIYSEATVSIPEKNSNKFLAC